MTGLASPGLMKSGSPGSFSGPAPVTPSCVIFQCYESHLWEHRTQWLLPPYRSAMTLLCFLPNPKCTHEMETVLSQGICHCKCKSSYENRVNIGSCTFWKAIGLNRILPFEEERNSLLVFTFFCVVCKLRVMPSHHSWQISYFLPLLWHLKSSSSLLEFKITGYTLGVPEALFVLWLEKRTCWKCPKHCSGIFPSIHNTGRWCRVEKHVTALF